MHPGMCLSNGASEQPTSKKCRQTSLPRPRNQDTTVTLSPHSIRFLNFVIVPDFVHGIGVIQTTLESYLVAHGKVGEIDSRTNWRRREPLFRPPFRSLDLSLSSATKKKKKHAAGQTEAMWLVDMVLDDLPQRGTR